MRPPAFPYAAIAESILPSWEISLAFVSPEDARALNKKLRGKSYVPNVLSYQVGEASGEVIICLEEAAKQAPSHEMTARSFVLFLFIHGCLHLEGRRHGTTMEKREKALLKKWDVAARPHEPTHRNRNRHRHVPSQTGRRRRTR